MTLHDTELCAHESGCDEPVSSRGYCISHYMRATHRNGKFAHEIPPKFKIYRKGAHVLGERRSDGARWCSGGNCFTPTRNKGKAGWEQCAPSQDAASRKCHTGWTPEEFDLALIAQGNRCAICGENPRGRGKGGTLVGDHDHAAFRTRKLLCGNCNVMLGMAHDNPAVLAAAIRYLEE